MQSILHHDSQHATYITAYVAYANLKADVFLPSTLHLATGFCKDI